LKNVCSWKGVIAAECSKMEVLSNKCSQTAVETMAHNNNTLVAAVQHNVTNAARTAIF